jgi:hypothetical protein
MGARLRRTARRSLGLAAALAALAACGARHDAADLAVGVEPFEQLRGLDVTPLRSGMVRAVRARAVPAPFEGLRELIGTYDVLYAMTGFDGSDGAWPDEEALVLYIEASREWPTEAAAIAAWRTAVRDIAAGMGTAPACATVSGPGFALRLAEWVHRDGWSVSATYAPGDTTVLPLQTPRHAIAVRRQALTTELLRAGAPNPDGLPTWESVPCSRSGAVPASDTAGTTPKTTRATP